MTATATHILRQTPVIAALVRTAALAAARKAGVEPSPQTLPGPTLSATVRPRSEAMIADYLRLVGGRRSAYKGMVPAHLFPQWGFPLLSRTLSDIPYDMTKVLNAGCKLEIHQPLPAGEPLQLSGRLESIDDDGYKALLHQVLHTGTASAPNALTSHMYAYVPLAKREGGGHKKRRPHVPEDAREFFQFKVNENTAWRFAVLTGDFNPVHWVPAYARAAGFRNTILHGFATMALAIEAINRVRFAGDPSRLQSIEVRFTRPLVLPARPRLFLDGEGGVFVGDAPGGPAYLTGTFTHT